MIPWSKAYDKGRLNLMEVLPVDVPLCISIEPTNLCNFKCLMCFRSAAEFQKKAGPFEAMDLQMFEKILADCKEITQRYGRKIKLMKLYSTGEPLLHPEIGTMARHIKEANICDALEITTNGAFLTEDVAQSFIDAKLDYLRVSIYSVRLERMARVTNQKKFTPQDIRDNVARLYELREKARGHKGGIKPFICAKIMDTHDEENEEFRQSYADISDEQVIDIPWEIAGTGEGELEKFYGSEKAGKEAQNEYLQTSLYKKRKACRYPFTHLTIRSNGDAVVCCTDWPRETLVGNVGVESIDEIWHGKRLYDFRLMQLKTHGEHHPLCASCEIPLRDKPEDDIDQLPIERLSWREGKK